MRTDNPTPKHSSFVTVAIELTVPLEKLGEEATSGRKKIRKRINCIGVPESFL